MEIKAWLGVSEKIWQKGFNLILVARKKSDLINAKKLLSNLYKIDIFVISCNLTVR